MKNDPVDVLIIGAGGVGNVVNDKIILRAKNRRTNADTWTT